MKSIIDVYSWRTVTPPILTEDSGQGWFPGRTERT